MPEMKLGKSINVCCMQACLSACLPAWMCVCVCVCVCVWKRETERERERERGWVCVSKYCQDEWHVFSSVGEQFLSFESFSELWSFIHYLCRALGYEHKDVRLLTRPLPVVCSACSKVECDHYPFGSLTCQTAVPSVESDQAVEDIPLHRLLSRVRVELT